MSTALSIPPESDFSLQNLPWGVFSVAGGPPHVGVAVGDHVLDMVSLARRGLLHGAVEGAMSLFSAPSLNPFLERGRAVWSAARERVQ